MKYLVNLFRILVGGLFIFSGAVKAIDPLGTSYKMMEYFDEFKMTFMEPLVNTFSVTMIVLEIVLGVALLFGPRRRWSYDILLIIIVFFTFLTGYTSITGHVTDCGCFGDFLKLKPIVSFEKDLILMTMIIVIFFKRQYIKPIAGKYLTGGILVLATIGSTVYCLSNFVWGEPQFDFRPYKVGNHLPDLMKIKPEEAQQQVAIFTYKDTLTGEVRKVINSSPDGDHWKMLERKDSVTKEGKTLPTIANFHIENVEGDELNDSILNNKNYSFMVVAWDLDKTHKDAFDALNEIAKGAQKDGYNFFALSASKDQFETFRKKTLSTYPFYFGDGTFVKTIMRSNPGLVLLKDGTVIAKWHYKKLPAYGEIGQQYLKK